MARILCCLAASFVVGRAASSAADADASWLSLADVPAAAPFNASNATWHVFWVGGQSNSVGTNSQTPGEYPTWPVTPRVQAFCYAASHGCKPGTFAPASVPIPNESNVGWSLTFANLFAQTLPATDGVVLVNTGVGGTGFHDGNWVPPNGPLAVRAVAAMRALAAALPGPALGGTYQLAGMLWHQGEEDAGDNRDGYHADYCTYLVNDQTALVDFFRQNFPGASPSTVFVNGGLLPYWVDNVAGGTGGVPRAIAALNTSRACTGTADSGVFPDFNPDGTPAGDPAYRSGASGMVIHFDATRAFFFGFEYFTAFMRARALTGVVPSADTRACPGAAPQPNVTRCG
jgi:Carbohydrate esterase, sialic acid-specific acetylesterase